MALHHFTSRGCPRPGQWVKVEHAGGLWMGIVDGPDHGLFRTRKSPLLADAVEVVGFPTREQVLANRVLADDDPKKARGRKGWYSVSVLELGSRTTAFHVLVDGERLVPVVSRADVVAHLGREKDDAGEYILSPDFAPVP